MLENKSCPNASAESLAYIHKGRPAKLSDGILWCKIKNGYRIFNLPKRKIFQLEDMGAQLWELFIQKLDHTSVVERICEEYDVENHVASEDVEAFVEKLYAHGIFAG